MALDLENHLVARANEAFEPLTANFELTPLCNLHCDMCFIRLTRQQVEERGGLRDADSWLAIAQQLQQLNTLFILLTGGEPMSHPEFHRIYTTLRSMGFIMTLNTNGTLITEQMCRETFREKPRRVNVTLYGSNADTYERLCHNREGYERTVRGLRLLREHNIDTKLNLSMVRENSTDYDEIMLLADELGIPVVSNSYMFPVQRTLCGRATHVVESRLPATDAAYFDNQWLRYKKGDEYDSFAKQAAHKGIEGAPAEEGYTLSCRAGRSSMWVSWHHHISPCVMMETPYVDLSTGGEKEIRELNERLWKRFDAADFSNTEFAVSYMYQDDYDVDGYPDILAHLKDKKIPIVSKGLEGRHNDNTTGVVTWFMSQYRRILSSDFDREVYS